MSTVDYREEENIALILLNRPPVNALDDDMIDALHSAIRRADADPNVRAIILSSALENVFCGGMDLKKIAQGDATNLRRFVYKLYLGTMDLVYRLTKPILAAINGPARGAGMTLAINCDVTIAARDTDVGYPEIDVGVIPAIHYVHLPGIIGRNKAFEMLFGGRPIAAAEAVRIGLLNEAVARERLPARAFEVARIYAEKSPTIMALGRQSFMRANDLDYRRNVENQIETLCNVFNTPDGQEGLRAFAEKRAARWATSVGGPTPAK